MYPSASGNGVFAFLWLLGVSTAEMHGDLAIDALSLDDECGQEHASASPTSDSDACAANALQLRSQVDGMPPSVRYDHHAPHGQENLANGVEISRWSSPHSHHGTGVMPMGLTDRPPHVTRVVLKPGQAFPLSSTGLKTKEDVMYVVLEGTVRCDFCKGGVHDLLAGDVFFTEARRPHGPFANHGTSDAVLFAATMQEFAYEHMERTRPNLSDLNLRQHILPMPRPGSIDLASWQPSGLPGRLLTTTCWNTGKVMVKIWEQRSKMPTVVMFKMGQDCFVPCHKHLSGVVYFVIRGPVLIHRDAGAFNSTYRSGDVHWVRPGFVYGPEYSSRDDDALIVGIGEPGVVKRGLCVS
eukprot:CAMPEP_0176131024 /NCGR_PEP_ID=MMETSP0120_2-20121206/66314_1 /TAXON_ID=160619 /ORGANISM="Kryptoperidinium foliaceum, Strain CCMP 1326" /LENGTH=352 /DNA_ID=CAMNT_0017466361 /DNA_START=36 /DNA_END=1094 /DNA_ORIENTATION=-